MSEKTNETTNKKPEVITNSKGLKYDPDQARLVVKGILTVYRFSTTKFAGDKEYYQVSVKTDSLTPEVIADIKKRFFSETKDKYLPSFIKEAEENGCKEPIYVNLKSQYEFGTFTAADGNKRYSYDDVIDMGDGLAPLKSDVSLSIRLTSGAAYPLALRIDKLVKQDASDYFD